MLAPERLPRPADPEAAARLIERFAATSPASARLARQPGPRALLECLGGNSPYLADLAAREHETLRRLLRDGPDAVVKRALAELHALPIASPRAAVAHALRRAKRVAALAIAVADIAGLWKLEQITAALSDLAEATLRAAVTHLLLDGHLRGDLRLPDPRQPEAGCGFVALGMGKLGARDLNYSSDIDLVLLHNPDAGVYQGGSPAAFYTRLARGLVALMETRDADGYVFRTDLRLRPDPAATPPCISVTAAIGYYESMGQNWERAAMIKARPVAGDLAVGTDFLAAIRPFVWRRHLDFAAIADIHAMKRRIDAHRDTALADGADPVARVAGHNVKLGEGGIREIEFCAQTLQMVWGGRDPGLRGNRTLDVMRALVAAGYLGRRPAAELAAAYRHLRRVEHRLQMVADRQTHALPEQRPALAAFATFMGASNAIHFARTLLRHLDRVRVHYAALFETADAEGEAAHPSLDFGGPHPGPDEAPPPATLAALQAMGYADPRPVVAAVRVWQSGLPRALRSQVARRLMAQLLPRILRSLGRQPDPDTTFRRFDAFLTRLPAGVQLLSLIQRNPPLLGRLAAVLGAAPSLGAHLANTPSALEGLLGREAPPDPARALRSRLCDASVLEDAVAIVRRTVREDDFRISVATLDGRLDADAAGLERAALADAALNALLPRVLADFEARNGRVRGGGLALVLLGKAGGREMMAGSDLDLMFVYDHPATVQSSAGARALPVSQWFIRAVHAVVAAITSPDAEGPVYAVDMRLRPSGNKGPVAVSLAAFEGYHAPGESAWTWERMALTRARVVAGPPGLRARLAAAIAHGIASAGPPARVLEDAAAMRARMLRDLPPSGPWDVKLRPGGQVEVEFIAQALQLLHPGASDPTTRRALENLRALDALSQADAALLTEADRVWRTVQGMLRIATGPVPPNPLPPAVAAALLRGAAAAGIPAVDIIELAARLDAMAERVNSVFTRIIQKGPS